MILNILILLLLTIDYGFCHRFLSYGNYSLYVTTPTEAHQLKFLKNLETQKYIDVIYWKRPVKLYHDVHLLVHFTDMEMFLERANHFKLDVKRTIEDVEDAFNKQSVKKYIRLKEESFNWENYHSIEDIYQWLTDTVAKHPQRTELINMGQSAEGRDIFAFAIKNRAKKNVIIEGGIHGNEWIAIEFVTYLINQLVNKSKSWVSQWGKSYNWYLIPLVNPDGFTYSHKTDRLWRKNRRVFGKERGVDLNRNFNYNFGAFSSSKDPKDDEYCGPSAFSEPETRALKNFIRHHSKNLKYYFSFHAYGQKIILPYGDRVKHIEDFTEMENYGKQAIIKMYETSRVKYSIGTFYDTMGVRISGNSASWVKKTFRVKYVMTFMLRDDGTYGYALPTELILPTCKETLAGLVTVMTAQPRYVRANLFSSNAERNVLSLYTVVMFVVLKYI